MSPSLQKRVLRPARTGQEAATLDCRHARRGHRRAGGTSASLPELSARFCWVSQESVLKGKGRGKGKSETKDGKEEAKEKGKEKKPEDKTRLFCKAWVQHCPELALEQAG